MIYPEDFYSLLKARGITRFAGVPCSYLSGPVELLERRGCYTAAANEGVALALAAGSALVGERTGVLIQNSGLGNLINPLTSLVIPYGLGITVFMSLRGWPDPSVDEPQHAVMGAAGHAVLDALGVRHWTLDGSAADAANVLDAAVEHMNTGSPAFVMVPKGTIGPATAEAAPKDHGFGRAEAIRSVVGTLPPSAAIIATTGYISRELCAMADRLGNLYMQGSMGHAAALGLGLAVSDPHRPVIVLDGDGAALMHLGTLSTVGGVAPEHFVHIVLDNGVYASTGSQPTTSGTTDFVQVARAAGFRTAVGCENGDQLAAALAGALRTQGPHFIAVRTSASGGVPPRVTDMMGPRDLKDRFARWVGDAV
ncbi:phosphonopyruvate decarboxylase [Streptomyces sp. CAU 1734]|uniref:phosphonopyruvate decarboxylase n=1 Tax=Streptomyces sp. CAU 1734 TaxID=3140360 RepID=UPI003260D462